MEARFFPPVQTGPGAHPASCTMGTVSFPRVKSGRGVMLTPHPLLVPWSRKSRAIPLLLLWAVRPVQSLSACTRVHLSFFYMESGSSRTRPETRCICVALKGYLQACRLLMFYGALLRTNKTDVIIHSCIRSFVHFVKFIYQRSSRNYTNHTPN